MIDNSDKARGKGTKAVSMSIVNEIKLSGKFKLLNFLLKEGNARNRRISSSAMKFSSMGNNGRFSVQITSFVLEVGWKIVVRTSIHVHLLNKCLCSNRQSVIATNMLIIINIERQT